MKIRKEKASVCTILFMLTFLFSTWPQVSHAELSDDLLPFRPDDCEREADKGKGAEALCRIKAIVNFSKEIASVFSGINGTLDTATTLLQLVGILEKSNLADEFRKLHEHLDRVAVAITWKNDIDARAKRLAKVLDAVFTAEEAARLNMPFTLNTPAVAASGEATINAGDDSQFLRYNDERVTDGEWKRIILDRPEVTNSHVYDWRLGVPELMQLISMRLIILAAIDSNFKNNMAFQSRLLHHRKDLLRHYTKMMDGIRCNWSLQWGFRKGTYSYMDWESRIIPFSTRVACADIHTGQAAISEWIQVPESLYPPVPSFGRSYLDECIPFSYRNNQFKFELPVDKYCEQVLFRDNRWATFIIKTIQPTEEDLRRQVLLRMPLFEMRSMIDTLYLYAHGQPDLTEREERIRLASNPNRCLDVQWGNLAPQTPVWLWDCNGGDAQWWLYDRQGGTILNPASSLCLDVQWGNSAPSTPVQLWDCNGRDAQKWTYDPEERVLQNALGTILLVKERRFCDHYVNGSCAGYQYYDEPIDAGTPVITGIRGEGYLGHQWISKMLPQRGRVPIQ